MYHLTHIQKPTRHYTLFITIHPSNPHLLLLIPQRTHTVERLRCVQNIFPSWQPHLLRIARLLKKAGTNYKAFNSQ